MLSPNSPHAGHAAIQIAAGAAIIAGLILMTAFVSGHYLRSIRRHNCIEALAWIAAAKEEIAQRDNLPDGAKIEEDALKSAVKLEMPEPSFPAGVEPQINPVGKLPTCVYNGETLTPLSDYTRFSSGETV